MPTSHIAKIPKELLSLVKSHATENFTLPSFIQVYASDYFLLYWKPAYLLDQIDSCGRIKKSDILYHIKWHKDASPSKIKGISQVALSFRRFPTPEIPPYVLISL